VNAAAQKIGVVAFLPGPARSTDFPHSSELITVQFPLRIRNQQIPKEASLPKQGTQGIFVRLDLRSPVAFLGSTA